MVEWEERPTETLPRYSHGCDWGCARKVVIRNKKCVVFWTPGSTGWKSVGVQGYYSGMLACHATNDATHDTHLVLRDAGERSINGTLKMHLSDVRILKMLAEHLGCAVRDIPAFKRGRTYVQVEP